MTATTSLAGRTGATAPKGQVLAWALWDWGSAAFNAVVTTFVFSVYLTKTPGFGGTDHVSFVLGLALAVSGVLVALLAPVTAQRSDGSGRRKFWLAVNTGVVVVCIALLFFVSPSPVLLWLGLALLAIGTLFFELGTVSYFAMLLQVSTPKTIGRISGLGWAAGYFGGIVLLLVLYFGLIHPEVGWFGVTDAEGLNVRVAMLFAAAWFALSALPVLFAVPEYVPESTARRERSGVFASYLRLFRDIAELWRSDRRLVWFLLSSAVFRDGLTGVFTFGGVLAAGTFGFSSGEVIMFAVAANVVAGVMTLLLTQLDDVIGPKPIILVSLVVLVVAGSLVFVLHADGKTAFWVLGLVLSAFVGAPQSASRSFLGRLIPTGREGEIFGLYATTGRAATFLAPLAFSAFVGLGGHQYFGVLGIVLVLLIGLVLLVPVRAPARAPR